MLALRTSHLITAEPLRGPDPGVPTTFTFPGPCPPPPCRPMPNGYTGTVDESISQQLRAAAGALLAALDEPERARATHRFDDLGARRWIEYRPRPRPGVCLADLRRAARKATHRLLASALSPSAYAQAVAIIGLEEILDRAEGGHRDRHSDDYWVAVFGDPIRDEAWGWRVEGHHLSISMTIVADQVSPAPIFFGANPAAVRWAGRPITRPLGPEEDLGRALLDTLSPRARAMAVIAEAAPTDIISATRPHVDTPMAPLGVSADQLSPTGRSMLDQLVALYLERFPPELADREARRLAGSPVHFAWAGPSWPGQRHYYRVQGDDLLIEYDNTADDGNHAHTVLRRPSGDFGGDLLAAHHRSAH
ncbi:hypothetical protein Strop_2146 [Salinispora tropica CNB-440]|uniref:DUF3500 domain-containing protein n=2 Tax=Salinispora tropica TaxID=168695 RepID=A4X6U7_SALTO|nr:hypothetical protein Strop_2146 [Salinispora tropica CNB-440]